MILPASWKSWAGALPGSSRKSLSGWSPEQESQLVGHQHQECPDDPGVVHQDIEASNRSRISLNIRSTSSLRVISAFNECPLPPPLNLRLHLPGGLFVVAVIDDHLGSSPPKARQIAFRSPGTRR
jgi:hypothetical protein